NRQAESIFGWSKDEVLGKTLTQTIMPATLQQAPQEDLTAYLMNSDSRVLNRHLEFKAVHRDGHEFPVEISITPIQMDDKTIFCSFLRDITERKKTELAIAESERHFRMMADTASVMIWMTDVQGAYTFFNNAWLQFTGHTTEEEAHQ